MSMAKLPRNTEELDFSLLFRHSGTPKKSKFLDCLAEFSVYFNGKSKNFLLKKFSKIFQNGGAMHGDIYVVKTWIFGPAC